MPTLTINLKLPVEVTKEADVYVSFCPVLDIASQGCTQKEAIASVKEAIELFITTCIEMGTINDVLRECGFTKGCELQPTAPNANEINVVLPYIAAQKIAECRA